MHLVFFSGPFLAKIQLFLENRFIQHVIPILNSGLNEQKLN